jgi:hypothetical protein
LGTWGIFKNLMKNLWESNENTLGATKKNLILPPFHSNAKIKKH